MRINKFIAQAAGIGRRTADAGILAGRIRINGTIPTAGQDVTATDVVTFDGRILQASGEPVITIIFNKPVGYVVSRNGQGSKTVYDLLPATYQNLKPIGRIDKDSSGLLLLTNDGTLANELTHPSKQKTKVYEIALDKALQPLHRQMINDYGIVLEDGPSKLQLERLREEDETLWTVSMHEGRNRQIRRTFAALGYTVIKLHRVQFGKYSLGTLGAGKLSVVRT